MHTPVRPAAPSEFEALAELLARAFGDEPLIRWLLPTEREWERAAARLFLILLRVTALEGLVLTNEQRTGVALWVSLEPPPYSAYSQMRALLPAPLLLRHRSARAWRARVRLKEARPTGACWYLRIIGTEPQRQGSGVGASLMVPLLQRCDLEGKISCLETGKRENLGFYRRHGFEIVREFDLARRVHVWTMVREPHSNAGPYHQDILSE